MGVCRSTVDPQSRLRARRSTQRRRAGVVACAPALLHRTISRRYERPRRHGVQLPESGPGRWNGHNAIRESGHVGPGLRGPDDLLYVPRLASSFDLTDEQTLLLGLSGAFGPNDTGPQTRTEIYGADVYWKWKPANAQQGFPFVAWQTETLWRRFDAGADPVVALPAELIQDYGFYSQLLWGFNRTGWPGCAVSGRRATTQATTRMMFTGENASGSHRRSPGIRASSRRFGSNTTTTTANISATHTPSGCKWNFFSAHMERTNFEPVNALTLQRFNPSPP